jgi:hypothetical protein
MGSWISQEGLEDAANIPNRFEQKKGDAPDSASRDTDLFHHPGVVHVGSFMPFEIVHGNEHKQVMSYAEGCRILTEG